VLRLYARIPAQRIETALPESDDKKEGACGKEKAGFMELKGAVGSPRPILNHPLACQCQCTGNYSEQERSKRRSGRHTHLQGRFTAEFLLNSREDPALLLSTFSYIVFHNLKVEFARRPSHGC
jgi:hypothetical protein